MSIPAILLAMAFMGDGPGVETFDRDPGWEGHRNRLLPARSPVTRQDFGRRPTHNAGGARPGEIGGWIQRSTTPASYARAIPPRGMDRKLVASGRFAVTRDAGSSGVMFGWFNKNSKGWRTPESIGFRLDGNGGRYWVFYEYGTRSGLTGGGGMFEGDRYQTTPTKPFPADGTSHRWTLTYDPAGSGSLSLELDGQTRRYVLPPGHKEDGATFDRFGIWNQQISGSGMEAYFADVVVDGEPLDLDADAGWLGIGNHVEFEDRVMRPFHDFGWSPTKRVGGVIWRDAAPAYYAARVDRLSLDQELSASGTIVMNAGAADSGVYLGWFDAESKRKSGKREMETPVNMLALTIEGPSRVGHYVRPEFHTATGAGTALDEGPILRPDGRVHHWSLRYVPEPSGGGRIVSTFDGRGQVLRVSPERRREGASFDRFGLFNMGTGGHQFEVYLDDLIFTRGQ